MGSVGAILMKRGKVSFYRSLHLVISSTLNIMLLLFSDFGARLLDQLLHFFYYGMRKPDFGHFCHIQDQAHVRLLKLYLTSLPCHSRRHVENLQEISC
jgi:hypothetical protein